MKRIGEDVAEKLDYVPGVFSVERHVRGKWACSQCESIVQAPVPAHVIDKGSGRVQVLLRPEQIRLLPSALAQASAPCSRLEAQTTCVTFNGHDALVHLQLLGSGLHLSARVPGHMAPVVGTTVLIAIEGAASAFPV